jgi:hypothetical protein
MRAWVCFVVLMLGVLPAPATEEFAASFRLRSGYDSNPLLAPRGKGSPLIAWEGAAVYGRDLGEWIAGATGEASFTRYREQEFEPVQNYRLRLRLANKNQNDISIDATTTLAHLSNYDTKSDLANQRVHVQWTGGKLRPFVAGDLRFASLNEANVLLGNFLPEPMRYLRGTITPGVAYIEDKSEAGVSLAVARTKYEQEPDLFGFRRDNDRVQPSIYAKYTSEELVLAGAVSYLRVYSQEEFFTDVKALLFEFSLAAKSGQWSGELALVRSAEDTTFPVSPVTINTTLQAKLVREIDGKTSAGIFGRVLHRDYWDSPFFSRTRVGGIEVTRELADDMRVTGELGFAKSLLISGDEADGVIATLALTKRFGDQPKK